LEEAVVAPDPLAIAAAAAQGFKNFQCVECAAAVKAALVRSGFHGEVVQLRGRNRRAFMVCFSYHEGVETITQTGIHVAVRIADTAFDNHHPGGMPYVDWLEDFDAFGGVESNVIEVF
jgi:hypothetical protein